MRSRLTVGTIAWCWMTIACSADDGAVERAREDLAKRLNVPVKEVQLVREAPRTWIDSNMGCVRVGVPVEKVYSEGSELVLSAAGKKHYYHARSGEPYVYCETPNTKRTGPVKAPTR